MNLSLKVENIVRKGENAGYQHFLLFLQCFISPKCLRIKFSLNVFKASNIQECLAKGEIERDFKVMPCCGYQNVVDTTGHNGEMAKYRGPTIEVERETIVRLRDVGTDNIAADEVCEDADEFQGGSKYRDEGTDNIATDKNYMERQNSMKAKMRTYVKYVCKLFFFL